MKYLTIVIIVLIAFVTKLPAADTSDAIPFYQSLNNMPSRKLLDMGYRYLFIPEKRDSAVVCYTIVANRYYDGDHSRGATDHSVVAMENLGIFYTTFHYDYRRAYEYLVQARCLAEKGGLTRHLPYIYLGICNIWKVSSLSTGESRNEYIELLRKAFQTAVETGNDVMAATILIVLCDEVVSSDDDLHIQQEIHWYAAMHKTGNLALETMAMLFGRAVEAFNKGDLRSATMFFRQASHYVDDGPASQRYRYTALSDEAQMLMRQGKAGQAIGIMQQLLDHVLQSGEHDYIASVSAVLWKMYADVGDKENAIRMHMLYLEKKDSLLCMAGLADLKDVETSAQLAETSHKLTLITHRRQMQQTITIAALIVALLLLVVTCVVVYAYRRLQQSNRMLYRKSVELLRREETRNAEHVEESAMSCEEEKYKQSRLDDNQKETILRKITQTMDTCTEIFSCDFCLTRLSNLVGESYRDVSQIINEQYGSNFKALLNEYRLREACRRLTDTEHYGHLTIEAIAVSVGFKSRSGFSALFKRYTGLTPSAYQKIAKADDSKPFGRNHAPCCAKS